MKPLSVAVVTKDSTSRDRETRNMGYWSYSVPEFTWEHVDGLSSTGLNQFDVVVQEDAGPRRYSGLRKPLVYVAIDSTLSEDHLKARLERARNANLILVDHDKLERFEGTGVPVLRWNYCANDHLFKPSKSKPIDVSFHCAGSRNEDRKRLRPLLAAYCASKNRVFRSGVLHPIEYAKAMAQSKIVVNWPKVAANRPHRVFDTMAAGTCLVSGPLPEVDGDNLKAGNHYFEVGRLEDIPGALDDLLESGAWQEIAGNGHRMVMKYHTWAKRAAQLREILRKELGL